MITVVDLPCPACGAVGLNVFYEVSQAPVHSVLLLSTRAEALDFPTGDIRLGFCRDCGFITNVAFDESVHQYSSRYEETQGFSATFNTFHRRLAEHLIDRYQLRNKDIIEIGCGKGEFLALLCDLGPNRGVGFDPAYVPGRVTSEGATFVKDFYSEAYADRTADFICCKMTLEHIPDVAEFVRVVRRSIGDSEGTIVFFQVPDARRILDDIAFWDIYYEHCSYFSPASLARLFRSAGFGVIDLWVDYDDQYLMIEAKPGSKPSSAPPSEAHSLAELSRSVERFARKAPEELRRWRSELLVHKENGDKVVLWGGGSKGVAFLTTLNLGLDCIEYAVDINPHKAGTFMAGTGQEIVPPDFLKSYRPDVVIVMNAIYRDEIKASLQELGLSPTLLAL